MIKAGWEKAGRAKAERRSRRRRLRERIGRVAGRRRDDTGSERSIIVDLTGCGPMVRLPVDRADSSLDRLSDAISHELTALLNPTAPEVAELAARHTLLELSTMPGLIAHRARISVEGDVRSRAVSDPGAAVVARLGPRPGPGATRVVWDEAVENMALYRTRWQPPTASVDLERSGPPRPTDDSDPAQHAEYWAVVDAVRRVDRHRMAEAG